MSALIQYLKRRHGAKGRGIGLGSMNLFLELFQLSVPSRYFKTSPEIIQLAVMLYVRFFVWLSGAKCCVPPLVGDTVFDPN